MKRSIAEAWTGSAFDMITTPLRRALERGLRSEFRRNALMLLSGAGAVQLISILAAPINTRLYEPGDYGVYAIYLTIAGVLNVVATGQYHTAVMLPKDDGDAGVVAILALTVTAGITAIVTMVAIGIGTFAANASISQLMWWIPVGITFAGLIDTLSMWMNRQARYRTLTASRLTQAVSTVAVGIGLGVLGADGTGLIIAGLTGQLVAICWMAYGSYSGLKTSARKVNAKALRHAAIEFKEFPLFNAPQSVFDSFRSAGIVAIIGSSFGVAAVGYYSLANRLVQLPAGLVAGSVSQVFYQRATNEFNQGRSVWPIARRTLSLLGAISIPSFLILMAVAPQLFAFVFSPKWRASGLIAQALCPWLMLNFLSSPISSAPLIIRRQRDFMLIGLGYNAAVLGALIIASSIGLSMVPAVRVLSLSAAVYLIGVLVWLRHALTTAAPRQTSTAHRSIVDSFTTIEPT